MEVWVMSGEEKKGDLKDELKKAILSASSKKKKPAAKKKPPQKKEQAIKGDNNIQICGSIHGDIIQTPKLVKKIIVEAKPGDEHITEKQMVNLRDLVDEIVQLEKQLKREPAHYQFVWRAVNKAGGANAARLIPKKNYEKAVKHARQWIGRLNSMPSAKKKNPNWRITRYRFIKTSLKQLDMESRLALLLDEKYSATSIKDLSDDSLEKVYRTVQSWKQTFNRNQK